MSMFTPKQWYRDTIGKRIDTDNYPRENPYQCWDYFDYFCRIIGFGGSRYCAISKMAGDIWLLRDNAGYEYSREFEYITDGELKDGDWIFWRQHVAFFFSGKEIGQNQGFPYVTEKTMNWEGVLGAFRWKGWKKSISVPYGSSDISINGHRYSLYRQNPRTEKIAVVAKALNEVAPIKELDIDKLVYAKVGGANYYQMKEGQKDPVGTTYGDISSPLTGVFQSLPNQETTLFYDMESGDFGDCTFHEVDRTHNVFSPALVFPNTNGNFEYARMVGMSHINLRNRYSFVIRFNDGYCVGLAEDEMTPREIAEDFQQTDMVNIAFLDGGGSAQFGRWNGTAFEYVRDTGRAIPSVIVIYREPQTVINPITEPVNEEEPIKPDVPAAEDETNEPVHEEPEEDKPMKDEQQKTISGQIAALIDVKSIMTIILICTLCHQVIHGNELDERFMVIVTAVVTFYFSYQVKKQ